MLGIFTNVRMPLHTESRFRGKAVDSPMIPNSVVHTAGNHCATVSPTKNTWTSIYLSFGVLLVFCIFKTSSSGRSLRQGIIWTSHLQPSKVGDLSGDHWSHQPQVGRVFN